MAKLTIKGIDTYIEGLQALSDATDEELGKAIYKGADIVADAARAAIQSLPVGHNPIRGEIEPEQKDGLLDGLGIASMQLKGTELNVKLGMDGYNSKGQPNSMILRSIEAGTSWPNGRGRPATPIIKRAVQKTRKQAEEAMVKAFEEAINRRMK